MLHLSANLLDCSGNVVIPTLPPARELGAIWNPLLTPTGDRTLLFFVFTFRFSVDTFPRHPRRGWHGDGFRCRFVSALLRLGLPFFSYFLPYVATLGTLSFRGVGVRFDEPHLRPVY